jgi:hypothetical protein
MWNQKPLEKESSEWCFHVDDLILLSEFDDVTSAVTAAVISLRQVHIPSELYKADRLLGYLIHLLHQAQVFNSS